VLCLADLVQFRTGFVRCIVGNWQTMYPMSTVEQTVELSQIYGGFSFTILIISKEKGLNEFLSTAFRAMYNSVFSMDNSFGFVQEIYLFKTISRMAEKS
jgi:hypothetical protein